MTLADGITLWGAAHRSPASTDGFLDGFTADRAGVNLALFHGCEAATASGRCPTRRSKPTSWRPWGWTTRCSGTCTRRSTTPASPIPATRARWRPGETGPRGAVLVTVTADGTVQRTRYDVAGGRLHEVRVDLTGATRLTEVRERVAAAVADCHGVVRATLHGALAPAVDLADLTDPDPAAAGSTLAPHLDGLVLREGPLDVAADLEALAGERTVRGQFVRDVRADPALDEDTRRRVLRTGLRALDGHAPEPAVVQP